jgi:3-hydroxymyristoyl/3-hydroxydecanoyl-(acyl carrier protein) dehydratase
VSTFEAILEIRPDHPAFPGHFPGNPILPGAVIAELVAAAAEELGLNVSAIESIKFGLPITAGGLLRIEFALDGPIAQFKCLKEERVVASGRMILGPSDDNPVE